jgi:hypothetical protein
MPKEYGLRLDLRLPSVQWIRAKSEFDNAGFQLTGRPVKTTDGDCFEFDISLAHWSPIKKMLEDRKIPYEFRDLSSANPTWQAAK